jgi:hypothetical protein
MLSRKAKNQATLIQCEPSCHFFLFLRQTLLGIIGWLKTKPMRFFSYVARK